MLIEDICFLLYKYPTIVVRLAENYARISQSFRNADDTEKSDCKTPIKLTP